MDSWWTAYSLVDRTPCKLLLLVHCWQKQSPMVLHHVALVQYYISTQPCLLLWCVRVSLNFTNGFAHNFVERLAIKEQLPDRASWNLLSFCVSWQQFRSFKSLDIYRPGSQRGGFATRRRWLPEWCVEEQKWCRIRCRWVVQGSLPGQCSYRLHRGGTLLQELALLPVVTPKTPGEGRKKGVRKANGRRQ